MKLDVEARRRDLGPRRGRGSPRSSARSGSWPARSSRSARRSSCRRSSSTSSACRRSGAARPGFSTDARVLQAIRGEHPIVEKIEDWRELSKLKSTYLDALPELIDAQHGPPPHDLQPDRHDDGPPVEHEPEPPERADPDRARARDPVVLRGRGRPQADLGRLLAGRAARARAHRRRGRAEGDLPARRGRAHGDRGHDPRAPRPRTSTRARARRRRWSTTGSSTASPPTAWPTGCRSRRTRRRSSSTATSTASRRSRSSSTRRSSTRARRGTSRRCSGASGAFPELRARQWTTRSLGERLAVNTVIQGTAADILKVAMLRTPRRAGRHATRSSCSRSTTSCCSRRRTTRSRQAKEIVVREMEQAYELEPPLEVDVGVGVNWTDAK